MMLMMIQIESVQSLMAFDYFMVHMEGAGASQSIPVAVQLR